MIPAKSSQHSKGIIIVSWEGLRFGGDQAEPYGPVAGLVKSVQAAGTFGLKGAVRLFASNVTAEAPEEFVPISVRLTQAESLRNVPEHVLWLYPKVIEGDDETDLTVSLMLGYAT